MSEFPIRKPPTPDRQLLSTNTDGLPHQRVAGVDTWWLFELKTDQQSVNAGQIDAYERACGRSMDELEADVQAISGGTNAKHKYRHLRDRLERPAASFDAPVRLVYLSPHPVPSLARIPGAVGLNFDQVIGMELARYPEAWALVCSHLLAPVIGR